MNVVFFSRSDITTTQKGLCAKIQNSKIGKKNSIALYTILCKYTQRNCFYTASTEKSSSKFIHSMVKVLVGKILQFEESDSVINSSMQQLRKLLPLIYCPTRFFFYKLHFYEQRQVEIGKKLGKSQATPWGWTLASWK